MIDRVKFHNITKPIRFRKLKLFKNATVLWCKALRERIKYLFNYILYKLNILKRYSYRDTSVLAVSLPHPLTIKCVSSNTFGGIVVPKLTEEKFIYMDYFYRETKGKRKITLSLKNVEETKLFLDVHLENIVIKVNGVGYAIHKLPTFKVRYLEPESVIPVGIEEPLKNKEVEYSTITLDTSRLIKIRYRSIIGVDLKPEDISKKELNYYYDLSVNYFKKYLEHITLNDLLM